jgi:hypothetical protein
MTLAPLVLDDLDWRELTDAARLRLPALSGGKWTLHAPVDPGITLVELFAWLLDQRVYWMDRVEEPLFRAAVELLGESMQAVRAARTVMEIERDGPLTHIAAGTTLEIARAEAGPVFAVEEGIELLDVGRVGLVVGGVGSTSEVDRENDLREKRGVTLFSSDGSEGQVKIVLHLSAAPAGPTARPFSLFIDVQAPRDVLPEWHPDATGVAPPAEITWWYSRGPGLAPRRFSDTDVHDGTRGLRRAGVLRLPIPVDWAPEGPPVGGLLPFAIYARTSASTFSFPVRVRRIVPNAAIAAHRHVEKNSRRSDWLPLPGLTIGLGETSWPPIPDAVRLRIREIDGAWHRWRPVPDFARYGPADRVFRVDRRRRRIAFGDGLTGRIPRPDPSVASNVQIAAMVGAGVWGNVGAGLRWSGDVAADVRATNLADAEGGREEETIDQARARISGLLERVARAVTAKDHVTLAEQTPGVAIARAHAAVGFHPGFPCSVVPGAITVFVVPWAPRGEAIDVGEKREPAPLPDPGALTAVRAYLERARMVGTEVWVCPPRYRTVRLGVRVLGDPVDPESARVRVEEALRRFLDPLEGGDDRAGWPFGDPIRPSVLMRETVPAVEEGEVESVAIGIDGADPSEDCREVPIGLHDLPALADVTVRFEADRRGRSGGLR